MSQTLDYYRSVIEQQPHCDDAWLTERLARTRAGDDTARREILGSYLRLALTCVQTTSLSEVDPSELIEEANAGLEEGLRAFRGQTTAELEACLRQHVQARLARMTG